MAHARPVAPANAGVLARLVALGYEVEVYQYAPLDDGRYLARHIAYRTPRGRWVELRPMVNMAQRADGCVACIDPGVLDEWERRELEHIEGSLERIRECFADWRGAP